MNRADMSKTREVLNMTVCTENTLKKIMIVLLAIMLVVNLSPFGALPSYAENESSNSGSLGAGSTNGLSAASVNDVEGIYVVGDQGFNALQDAIDAANDGDVIWVSSSDAYEADETQFTKSVTLMPANGSQSMYLDYGAVIAEGKTLTVAGSGNDTLNLECGWTVSVDGTLNLNSGATLAADNYNNIRVNVAGTLNVNDGATLALKTAGSQVYVYGGALNVSGGSVEQNYTGDAVEINSWADHVSAFTMTGGSLSATNGHALSLGWGSANISGGTLTAAGDNTSAVYVSGKSGELAISGGTFVGPNAVSRAANYSNYYPAIPISGGVFKATSGYAFNPYVKADLSGDVKWSGQLQDGSYTAPEGYGVSVDTVKVDGIEGDFHYLARQLTITYDGNGGTASGDKTTLTDIATGAFSAADNAFVQSGKVFKEWNTAADGSGSGYVEGAEVPATADMTLYAIWDEEGDAVSINSTLYDSLHDAVAAANDGDTLLMLKSTAEPSENLIINKNVTIVSNVSKAIASNALIRVAEGKSLTLGNGDSSKMLVLKGDIETSGNVVLNDGAELKSTSGNAILVKSTGAYVGNGGKVSTTDVYALKIESGSGTGAAKNVIHGGEYSSTDYALYCYGEIDDITGGTFRSTKANDYAGALFHSGSYVRSISGGSFIGAGSAASGVKVYGGTIDEISGGEFIGGSDSLVGVSSPNAYGLKIATGAQVKKISGGVFKGAWGTLLPTSAAGPLTISGGEFIGSNTALQVQKGSEATIEGGTFSGNMGITNWGTITSMKKATIDAKNAAFINYSTCGDIADCTIHSANDDAITNTSFFNTLGVFGKIGAIENCKVNSEGGYALYNMNGGESADYDLVIDSVQGGSFTSTAKEAICNDGTMGTLGGAVVVDGRESGVISRGAISEISGGTYKGSSYGVKNIGTITSVTGGKFYGDSYGVFNAGSLASVVGGEFTGGYYGMRSSGSIDEVSGGAFKGEAGLMVWGDGVDSVVAKVSGGTFEGSDYGIWNYDGTISEISGGTCKGVRALQNYKNIGVISGGSFSSETQDGAWNNGSIDAITGGTFTGKNDGVKNNGTIGSITGGSFAGEKWFGIWNNGDSASVSAISIAKDASSVFSGGYSAIGNYSAVASIGGYGVFIGGSRGTLSNYNNDAAIPLEGSLSDVVVGSGRYADNSTLLKGEWTLPDGYHMSNTTTNVQGQSGAFHFLVKENTVVYKGNGHKLAQGTGLDDETFLQGNETVSATIADNDFGTGRDFQFAGGGADFLGWNTEADGSGTSYKAGDVATVPAGEELVLYAQWDASYYYEVTPAGQKNEGNGQKFRKLEDAINATTAETPQVLVLKTRAENRSFTINADKTVILNVVTQPEDVTLTINGAVYVKGSFEINDGITVSVPTSQNDTAVDVLTNGTFTMNGGHLASTTNYGLHVEKGGKVTQIQGGEIEGIDGIYCSGEIGVISGGTIWGNFLNSDHGSSLKLSGGGHIGTISGGTFNVTGSGTHAVYVWANSSSPAIIDTISGGEFNAGEYGNALYIYGNSAVTTIEGGTFSGEACVWVWPTYLFTGRLVTIKGGQFNARANGGSAVYLWPRADVEILGGKFTGYVGITNIGKLESIQNATIEAVYGIDNANACGDIKNTTVHATGGSAICNENYYSGVYGKIGNIVDCAVTAEGDDACPAIENATSNNTIASIQGGSFSSANGAAVLNKGTISLIEGNAVIAATASGSAIENTGTVGHLIGNVVLIGQDHAITNTGTFGLEDSGDYDLTAGNASVQGYVRYQTSSNTRESQLGGAVAPAGYHMSDLTAPVAGQNGVFHYLLANNTVIYDGNGHSLEGSGASQFTKKHDTDSVEIVGNNTDAFHFAENGKVFIGWNTAADGSGTAYDEGDTIELNGGDIVLYAQWGGDCTIEVRNYLVPHISYNGEDPNASRAMMLVSPYFETYKAHKLSEGFRTFTLEQFVKEHANSDDLFNTWDLKEGEQAGIGAQVTYRIDGRTYVLTEATVDDEAVTDFTKEYKLDHDTIVEFVYELADGVDLTLKGKDVTFEYDGQTHEVTGLEDITRSHMAFGDLMKVESSDGLTKYEVHAGANKNSSWAPHKNVYGVGDSGKLLPEGIDYATWEKTEQGYLVPTGQFQPKYNGQNIYNKYQNDFFALEYVPGTVTVTPAHLKIALEDEAFTLGAGVPTGKEVTLTAEDALRGKVQVDGLKGQDKLASITISGFEQKPGAYEKALKVSNVVIQNADGDDVTNNYTIEFEDGSLTIVENDIAISYASANADQGSVEPATETVKEFSGVASGSKAIPKEGYRFVGWYDAQGNLLSENAEFAPAQVNGKNVAATYTARFAANKYDVTFDSAGGTSVDAQVVEHGKTAVAPTDPTRDGYTFAGWFKEDAAYSFSTPVTSSFTLVAHWTQVATPAPEPEPMPVNVPELAADPTPAPADEPDSNSDAPTGPVQPADESQSYEPALPTDPGADNAGGEPPAEPGPTAKPSRPDAPSDATVPDDAATPEEPEAPAPADEPDAVPNDSTPSADTPAPVVFAPLPPIFTGGNNAVSTPDDSVAEPAITPAAEEPVPDEGAPLAEPPAQDSIDDADNPLALVQAPGYWSLVDLLATIATVIAALILFASAMRGEREDDRESENEKKRDSDEERKNRTPLPLLLAGVALAVASVVAVLITQDFTNEMALFDAWSPLFIAGTVINVVLVIVEWRLSCGHDDDSGAEPAPAAA